MFEREHHRAVALVLQALRPDILAECHCWFGGGTAMALRYGEYRESIDVDFLVSDRAGYRRLRQLLGGPEGLQPIVRGGLALELAREVRTDQYGIRTQVRSGSRPIKFEIVLEGRIELAEPAAEDQICGVRTLTPVDLAAEELLANADRWADDAVHSRDLIDLAMQDAPRPLLLRACGKAEEAYGASVRAALAKAIASLRNRPSRLQDCMQALSMTTVSRAALWQKMRRLERTLAPPAP